MINLEENKYYIVKSSNENHYNGVVLYRPKEHHNGFTMYTSPNSMISPKQHEIIREATALEVAEWKESLIEKYTKEVNKL